MTRPWEGTTAPAPAAGAPSCSSCSPAPPPSPGAGAASGTNGAFVAVSGSWWGVSAAVTVDSYGNVYSSTGAGAVAPGASIAVGTFHSNGAPEDYFVGKSTCGNVGTEGVKVGGEVCTNDSGNSAAITWGAGVSPVAVQQTMTTKLTNVGGSGLRESPARRGAARTEAPPDPPPGRVHGH